ncbi:hypothetical protein MKZ38_004961 [Zalerion maritima]|uniref:Uncharacterized protein n=1 Tax=Zalerion maritima TaxID=339359 RepID=A0AAD5WP98_9PEZI|nr:hypothetical protein MKZ38_004961 [Zalerion maritima]
MTQFNCEPQLVGVISAGLWHCSMSGGAEMLTTATTCQWDLMGNSILDIIRWQEVSRALLGPWDASWIHINAPSHWQKYRQKYRDALLTMLSEQDWLIDPYNPTRTKDGHPNHIRLA